MLPKQNRFTFKSHLPKQILNSDSFSVRYGKNEQELKVGVVVSKKVDKRAVVRNNIKRVIVSAVRLNMNPATKITLIFYAKEPAAVSKSLTVEVVEVINKLNI